MREYLVSALAGLVAVLMPVALTAAQEHEDGSRPDGQHAGPVSGLARQHPFLLVRKPMYPELRARADREPWQGIKSRALRYALEPIPERARWDWWYQAGQRMHAAALAHVLDPQNAAAYRRVVLDFIEQASIPRGRATHGDQVPPGVFALSAIIALDVMHDDIATEELKAAEDKLGKIIEKVRIGWYWNWMTVKAVWALYNGDLEGWKKNKALLDELNERSFSPGGVFSGGPGYARARFVWRRISKYYLWDIAEFNGLGNYYDDPLVEGFYEWFYGYSFTPMGSSWTFGDTNATTDDFQAPGTPPWNMHVFSDKAAAYAAFRKANSGRGQQAAPPGFLHTYLYAKPLPEPVSPPSRVFPQGCAVFHAQPVAPKSMAAVLWNCTRGVWHTHSETNAISACAYGEVLLRGVGYFYPNINTKVYDFPFFYCSHAARANNTLTIDRVNHVISEILPNGGDFKNDPDFDGTVSKRGAGFTEWFTGEKLDYACGHSGKVVPNGVHERSLVMIHPQDAANGYLVLLDEVRAGKPGARAHLHLHPYSRAVGPGMVAEAKALEDEHAGEAAEDHKAAHVPLAVVSANCEYEWPINPPRLMRHDRASKVKVAIFLGHEPARVDFPLGVMVGSWGGYKRHSLGSYLDVAFDTADRGRVNIPTVIYPSDPTHPKANMKRISGKGYSGIEVAAGRDLADIILAADPGGSGKVTFDGVELCGRSAIVRRGGGSVSFYFARLATKLDAGRVGFSSDQPVSLYMKKGEGRLVARGGAVTFYMPGVTGIAIDGEQVAADLSGGAVTITAPAGRHAVKLLGRQHSDSVTGRTSCL